MFRKKTILTVLLLNILCVSAMWAGDAATFVDLGFSLDGRRYMFGQYGVQAADLRPWADLFVVDVPANNFVPNGRISFTQAVKIKAGHDGSGIFYRLLTQNANLARQHGIDFANQGQPLYISLDNNPSAHGQSIDFNDFERGKHYQASLIPTIDGTGQNIRSSFYIDLRCSNTGRNITVGNPQIRRQHIASYHIKRVLMSPQGDSMIFVIEMRRVAGTGHDIRYMIEALKL